MSFLCDMGERICVEYRTNPAIMCYSHVHPQYEMYFCPHSIPQSLVINGTEILCDSPCVVLSAPYSIHAMSPLENRIFERIVVYFGERTLSSVCERLLPHELLGHSMGYLFRLDEASASMLRRTINGLTAQEKQSESEIELTFLLFLHKLFSLCPAESISKLSSEDFYIRKVLQYIVEHVEEHHDSAKIAAHFAVSRSKLDRDFKQATGYTPHDFADSCRLHHAKNMLLSSRIQYNMEQIATACGFLSQTYFYSFFKKHTGMSPLQYRRTSNKTFDASATGSGCQ